jgi:hypothetical protein
MYPKLVLNILKFIKSFTSIIATLALGSRPRQGVGQEWAKSEPESHISCSQECKKVWRNEPPHSQVGSHFASSNPNGFSNLQREIEESKLILLKIFFYIIKKLLERKCRKWARMTHLGT